MSHMRIITDKEFGLEPKPFSFQPRERIGARGIIINTDGNIAIFNKSNKNEYKLPGGGVDDGEDFEEAFKREAMEETGCEIKIIKKLGTIVEEKSQDDFIQVSHVFVAQVIKDKGTLHLTEKEVDEGAKLMWVSPEKGLELITNCINNLIGSNYENVYHTKFIVTRDRYILEHYINDTNKQ